MTGGVSDHDLIFARVHTYSIGGPKLTRAVPLTSKVPHQCPTWCQDCDIMQFGLGDQNEAIVVHSDEVWIAEVDGASFGVPKLGERLAIQSERLDPKVTCVRNEDSTVLCIHY